MEFPLYGIRYLNLLSLTSLAFLTFPFSSINSISYKAYYYPFSLFNNYFMTLPNSLYL